MKKAHPFVLFAGKTGRRMNIKIVGRKVNLRENFKELVQRKLSKFDRIFDEATVFKLRGESFRGKKLDTVSVQTGKVKAVELLADQQEE